MREIVTKTDDAKFWEMDPKEISSLLAEKSSIESRILYFDKISDSFSDVFDLLDLTTDGDGILEEIEDSLSLIYKNAKKAEHSCLFTHDTDTFGCFVEIQAGAGGLESQDWVTMLLRMYLKWAKGYHDFEAEIVDQNYGDGDGLRSVIIKIEGDSVAGWMRSETGVHRLVRISPFDSNARRHTSFASVIVSPIIDQSIEVEINEKDLRIDTYRASGAGGQHVNKTDSAIRITHMPTGIVVQCQTDRSQHKNRAEAMRLLKSKLYNAELKKKEDAKEERRSMVGSISWGNQIRSYVMQPYQLVKDLRTGIEKGNITAVLDGDLDEFMVSFLSLDERV